MNGTYQIFAFEYVHLTGDDIRIMERNAGA